MSLRKKLRMAGLLTYLGAATLSCEEYFKDIEGMKVGYNQYFGTMIITKGDTTFSFCVDWPLTDDNLEFDSDQPLVDQPLISATVKVGDREKIYIKKGINPTTLSGRINEAAFDRFEPWYNHLRGSLRDSLRADYLRETLGVELHNERW